jgi:hypothetical protein
MITTHVFIEQIFMAAEKAPLSHSPPTVLFRKWISGGSFYSIALIDGFEAVRIRVNYQMQSCSRTRPGRLKILQNFAKDNEYYIFIF